MTLQREILDNPDYLSLFNHGFVGLLETMGSDQAIVDAARISYGSGTKSVREDRGLIRYLFGHHHWTPVEMVVVKFHLKLPIFVMRQLVRHRASSVNEYSGRYSRMTDEFYVPEADAIQPQSNSNKQGRDGTISDTSKRGVCWIMEASYETAYDVYQALLGEREPDSFCQGDVPYGAYDEDDPLFSDDFSGIARELARIVLPVGNYTEVYWKQDLRNLFHLLKERGDSHAQPEIRAYADAMYQLIKPRFPLACEAYEDYMRDATTLSRMEKDLLHTILDRDHATQHLSRMVLDAGGPKEFAEQHNMTKRELDEFQKRFGFDQ